MPGEPQHDHGGKGQGHGADDHKGHHAHMAADFRRRFWVSLVLTAPILLLSPLIREFIGLQELAFRGDVYVLFGLSSMIFFYGGYPFLKGLVKELSDANPGMMTLIGVAVTVAYAYSSLVVFGLEGKVFFWELATLIDIMLLGHWIEMKSVMGASSALEKLAQLMPSEAHLLNADGSTREVPIQDLSPGDRVLVKPGEKFPVDGVVTDGESAVNQAMITGESTPVSKSAGGEVVGGSINGDGALTVEVEKAGRESYLSRMIAMVEETRKSKSRSQDLANRAARWLTFLALASGGVTLVAWLAVVGREFDFSLERAVTVMVITCPHALGLAIPLVVAVSTSLSARNGLLIRNRTAFEKARGIEAVIFDKTGTLTEGKFAVTDTVSLQTDVAREDVLAWAAAVEADSEHPIARGILDSVDDAKPVKDFKAIPGKGAKGTVEGRRVKVVSPGYLAENGIEVGDERIERLSAEGKTVVFVLLDEEAVGALALADVIREESRKAVSQLKQMGVRCLMLTGDNRSVARWVAERVGLDDFFAEVLPEDKAEKVKEVQTEGLVVAMVGDGVNDAPALAQADVGIAIGAGTDVAAETADIVLVRSNPLDVLAVIQLARATYRKMLQNLGWAAGYNAFAIPLAAGVLYAWGVLLSPAVGALLMSVSTVVVAVNARFLKIER
jgi:P-type Cu2+ transporter